MGLKLARQDDVEWDGNASLQLKQRSTRFPHFRPHTLSPYPESHAGLEAVGLYFLFRLPQQGGLQGLFWLMNIGALKITYTVLGVP